MLASQKQSRIKHHGKFKNSITLGKRTLLLALPLQLDTRRPISCLCATGVVLWLFC